jgi:hypothetical protein
MHKLAAFWLCLIAAGGQAAALAADERPLREVIDIRIQAGWQTNGVIPAEAADDAAFLRRVSLDLVGAIPTAEEATAFLDDAAPDKRATLIDRLLADPRYAQHQSDVWDMVLFGRHPPGYETQRREGFQRWLREQFAQNVPYHQWIGQMLRAEGNSVDQGAPMYLVQYRNAPEDAAVAITQTFLGVQLQCARCHDHPYEDWSQQDFFGMAAFLTRLQVVDAGKADNQTKWMIGEKNLGELMFTGPAATQEAGKKGAPIQPKFLHGDTPAEAALPADFKEERHFPSGKEPTKPQYSRKDLLASWVANPENPYFARAVANRVWGQFLGRGIVHPVDNMSPSNKPSHPELLDELARALVEHQFDLKWYIRELVNTRTYQLASHPSITGALNDEGLPDVRPRSGERSYDEARPLWFQQGRWRPLSAEELIDSWRIGTGFNAAAEAAGKPPKHRFEPVTRDYLLQFFGEPTDGTGNFQGGLHEHLYLNNGELPRIVSSEKGSLYESLIQSDQEWPTRVERLYLSILTRRPTAEERDHFVTYLTANGKPEERLREAIWTLMTCSEFRFNH